MSIFCFFKFFAVDTIFYKVRVLSFAFSTYVFLYKLMDPWNDLNMAPVLVKILNQ
jgi:hypothetical protein